MPIVALMLCGILHVVGSERDTSLVLDDGQRRVGLEGPVADSLAVTTWNRICLDGERTSHLVFGAAFSLLVAHARPEGDGYHAPIAGILERFNGRETVLTSDGRRFLVRFPSDVEISPWLGTRVWLIGKWQQGQIIVVRFGPF